MEGTSSSTTFVLSRKGESVVTTTVVRRTEISERESWGVRPTTVSSSCMSRRIFISARLIGRFLSRNSSLLDTTSLARLLTVSVDKKQGMLCDHKLEKEDKHCFLLTEGEVAQRRGTESSARL